MSNDVASLMILCGFIGLLGWGAGNRRAMKLESRDGTRLNWTQYLVTKRQNGKAGRAATLPGRETERNA